MIVDEICCTNSRNIERMRKFLNRANLLVQVQDFDYSIQFCPRNMSGKFFKESEKTASLVVAR